MITSESDLWQAMAACLAPGTFRQRFEDSAQCGIPDAYIGRPFGMWLELKHGPEMKFRPGQLEFAIRAARGGEIALTVWYDADSRIHVFYTAKLAHRKLFGGPEVPSIWWPDGVSNAEGQGVRHLMRWLPELNRNRLHANG